MGYEGFKCLATNVELNSCVNCKVLRVDFDELVFCPVEDLNFASITVVFCGVTCVAKGI